jgi:hypothetical protein
VAPTFEASESFQRDKDPLPPVERDLFQKATRDFSKAIRLAEENGGPPDFPAGLRVKSMRGRSGVFEMTWERNDGRATFSYGQEVVPGKRHVMWRRIGTHGIFGAP